MSFANPLFLLGLFGAAVPIIIHLIHKRKPRKQAFAAMELLMRSIERVERRWRIKRFLLLAARVTLLAALALAAAGPMIGSEEALSVVSSGPKRIAIVIDASLSMRASYGKTSAWSKAITNARSIVDAMGPEDQAILVAARAKPVLLMPRPTASRTELIDVLDKLQPSYGRAELGEAVSTAAQALASLHGAEGADPEAAAQALAGVEARVVVLSDLAGHAVQAAAELTLGSTGRRARLEVVDVLADVPKERRENRAIVGVEPANVPGRAPRTLELRARVQSFTDEKKDQSAAGITLNGPTGALEQASVELIPGTVVDKSLRHSFDEAGWVPVDVTLEHDVLVEDDVRFAIADVRRQVRTLIVDGAPSGVPKEDEVFYLERALAAGAADQPPPRVITPDDLPHTDLGIYDVVVLAGVNSFVRSDGQRLVEFVERGGGLLVTASTDLDTELYNAELGRILPRALRVMKVVDPSTGGLGADGLVTLRAPAFDHPVMEIFGPDTVGGLLSARTNAYLLLEPNSARRPAKTLVEYDDGQPALVEADAGQGKVALLTTSVDRDLTDLPIRPAFLPLMRRLVLHLGGALSKPDTRNTLVGDARAVRVPPRTTRLTVLAPDGRETTWTAAELTNAVEVQFEGTTLPGHYQVQAATTGALEPVPSESFAVNVDTRESDLRPISVEEAAAVLTGTAEAAADASASAIVRARALRGLTSPDALAGLLLVVMALAFLVESALTAQKIGR
ncbi:BatA domain-containing protein [Myxococcota bacterium]|nr:BatA domain-containing protein [Myxococcota bacterium]